MRGEVECDGGPTYDWRRCGACHRRGALVRHFMIGIAPVLLVGHVLAVRRTYPHCGLARGSIPRRVLADAERRTSKRLAAQQEKHEGRDDGAHGA